MNHSTNRSNIESRKIRSKRVVLLKSEPLSQWDKFVDSHPYGSIYHLSSWKKVIEKSFKHIKGNILAICDNESNKIMAGLPIYNVRSGITGDRLVSVPFALFSDPLVSTPEDIKTLLPSIFEMHKQKETSFIEFRTLKCDYLADNLNFGMSNYNKHHFLLLDRNPDQLFKSFHKKAVRVPVLKAMKNNIGLKLGETEADLSEFYKIYFMSRKRLGLPSIPYKFFRSLWEVFYSLRRITLLLAVFEGRVIGGSILLKYKDSVNIEFGCDNIKFRHLCVNQFLDWETVKLAYSDGFKLLSFGRTSCNNSGLMVYKNRWGTKTEDLPKFFFPPNYRLNDEENESSWKYKLVRMICKKAPNSIFQLVSRFVYRHIG